MRVLFDGYWWINGPPSGRSVVRGLVTAWAATFPDDKLVLRVPNNDHLSIRESLDDMKIDAEIQKVYVKNHAISNLFTLNFASADVIVNQNFSPLFARNITKVSFVHDAIYKTNPEWFTTAERRYLSLIDMTSRNADLIATSSEAEAQRLRQIWPNVKVPICAVGLAVPDWVKQGESVLPDSLQSRSKPYVLTVGRLNIRKNLLTLLHAFEMSESKETHDLYVVGEPDGKSAGLSKLSSSIVFLPGVSNSQLSALYRNASALVFPSLDEGFGLPLLEGAAFDLPIAASAIDVFREIGVVDEYFDPESKESMANAIDMITIKQKRSDKQGQISRYSWSATVQRLRAAIVKTGVRV